MSICLHFTIRDYAYITISYVVVTNRLFFTASATEGDATLYKLNQKKKSKKRAASESRPKKSKKKKRDVEEAPELEMPKVVKNKKVCISPTVNVILFFSNIH